MNVAKLVFRLLLGRRLPTTTGTLQVPGIRYQTTIRRDRYGVAYVEAEEDDDAWYGLGFCHGQDRAFQLEGLLRIVRGTMAELIGPEVLPLDRLARRIGFRRAAEAQLPVLDDDVRRQLDAYARGVTAGAALGCNRPAHEYALLRSAPTRYEAADALGVLKLMSFNLAANWDVELARFKILTEDGPEALAALDPTYPEWLPVTSPPTALAGRAADRLAEDLALFQATAGPGGGSNNWAIAPSRTYNGRAIVANDPHLSPSLPPHWYLAHVRTPRWTVAGASFVGTPAFPTGYNGFCAWGNTAGLVDNTDLFVEEIGADGSSVREGERFLPCETRVETIRVKGQEAVREEVLITPRGPIIGPALEGEPGAISLRATWLDPRPVRGLYVCHQARSFPEFRHAFEAFPTLSLNMVYADVTGTVGWQLVGEAPRRRKGWGTLPLPGWDPEVGWEADPVPFEQMPYVEDPETGFVATANNQPVVDGQSPYLGSDWLDGYRLARIVEALGNWADWDMESTLALQLDQTSMPWHELRDVVLGVPAETDAARQALALLEVWDGKVAADSPAAAVYEFFVAEMAQRIAQCKAPRSAAWALGKGFAATNPETMFFMRRMGHLCRLARERPTGWFEPSWEAEMADALSAVVDRLREHHGNDPAGWAWGQIRTLTLRHAVGGQAPLDRVFNLGPFAWGGDGQTLGHGAVRPRAPGDNPDGIASLRMVVEVGDWEGARFVLPGGQSGNPLSPHYDDQLELWKQGEGIPIAWAPEKVQAVGEQVLTLQARHKSVSADSS